MGYLALSFLDTYLAVAAAVRLHVNNTRDNSMHFSSVKKIALICTVSLDLKRIQWVIGLMFEKTTCTTWQKLLSPPGNLLHFDTQLCKSWAWSQHVLCCHWLCW